MHTCFAALLAQTFKIPATSAVSSPAFAELLLPSLRQHSRRFITTAPLHSKTRSSAEIATTRKPRSQIPSRDLDTVCDPKAWIKRLDGYLPAHLHTPKEEDLSQEDRLDVSAADYANFLVRAHEAQRQDILSHLGLNLGRWQTLTWLVKKVIRELPPARLEIEPFDPLKNIVWPIYSLDKATGLHMRATTGGLTADIKNPGQTTRGLDHLTESSALGPVGYDVQRLFLGLLWRALGNMIIAAAHDENADARIMPVVLQILAELHHNDMIPEMVYKYDELQQSHALHQPLLLNLLSSRILTALSDAAWQSHETAVHESVRRSQALYFLGYEIPGSRHKSTVPKLGPEVWMELVLWSCLHGGWILEGSEIVLAATSTSEKHRWSLISWQDTLQTLQRTEEIAANIPYSVLKATFDSPTMVPPRRRERASVEKTITSEVVVNFIDRLVDDVQLRDDSRGIPAPIVIQLVLQLKDALDHDHLGLGGVSWNAIILRLLEPEGLVIEKDPRLALRLASIATTFGQEFQLENSPSRTNQSQKLNYLLEASAATLGVYHRAIRAFTKMRNLPLAIQAFERLLEYADANKRRSIEEFFHSLKKSPTGAANEATEIITGKPRPVDFPGFSLQLPSSIFGGLLDLATETHNYEFAKSLLYSDDVDGPMIGTDKFLDRVLAPSLIRYGSATRDRELLQKILTAQMFLSNSRGQPMPPEVLRAFLGSQISNRSWQSVENLLRTIGSSPVPHDAMTVAMMARQLLCHGPTAEEQRSFDRLVSVFKGHARHKYGRLSPETQHSLNIILAMLASIDQKWKQFGATLFTSRGTVPLQTDIECFNEVLEGVVETHGTIRAKMFVDSWCFTLDQSWTRFNTVSAANLEAESHDGPERSRTDMVSRKPASTIVRPEGVPIDKIRGRFNPNIRTIRILMRSADTPMGRAGRDAIGASEDRREVMEWGKRALRKLGFDREDLAQELSMLSSLPAVGG